MSENEGRGPGRPRAIETPERMDELVSEYVAQSQEDGQRLTLTGLILHLGLSSRQSFDEYLKYDGFSDSVKRAKLLIENEYEKRLASSSPAGAIFALKNFDWKDKTEHGHSGEIGIRKIEYEIVDPANSDA